MKGFSPSLTQIQCYTEQQIISFKNYVLHCPKLDLIVSLPRMNGLTAFGEKLQQYWKYCFSYYYESYWQKAHSNQTLVMSWTCPYSFLGIETKVVGYSFFPRYFCQS